jgi:hypothetical protein
MKRLLSSLVIVFFIQGIYSGKRKGASKKPNLPEKQTATESVSTSMVQQPQNIDPIKTAKMHQWLQ